MDCLCIVTTKDPLITTVTAHEDRRRWFCSPAPGPGWHETCWFWRDGDLLVLEGRRPAGSGGTETCWFWRDGDLLVLVQDRWLRF
ncbi:hypothetical protein EYF80_058330 [Liparis tanakae]|uniref:Uncharacterized protein n=1 Tax=Liparis tanakae TaxID=230148 RepID=A0A4Z2ESC3_9TELE|nr:hypothetical protein EYF80_058330 [Liparis tanakae]